jgi:hypothetical protein
LRIVKRTLEYAVMSQAGSALRITKSELHVLCDAAAVGISELSRWICSERRENLPIVHASLRHESEFQRRVVEVGIPDIRSNKISPPGSE